MKKLKRGWDRYLIEVIPPTAGEVQKEESRRAFYAGAVHLFATVMEMMTPGKECTEEDVKNMNSIHDELVDFKEEMKLVAEASLRELDS